MYPEEIWEAIQRHPSGKPEPTDRQGELNDWCKSVIEQDANDWADWLEETYDPDAPVPYLPTDRIEDLEI